jgi:hypothetical protein
MVFASKNLERSSFLPISTFEIKNTTILSETIIKTLKKPEKVRIFTQKLKKFSQA